MPALFFLVCTQHNQYPSFACIQVEILSLDQALALKHLGSSCLYRPSNPQSVIPPYHLSSPYSSINPYDFFLSLVIVTSLAQWHFIIFVIDEMTSVLQIRVFRVKPVRTLNNNIFNRNKLLRRLPHLESVTLPSTKMILRCTTMIDRVSLLLVITNHQLTRESSMGPFIESNPQS